MIKIRPQDSTFKMILFVFIIVACIIAEQNYRRARRFVKRVVSKIIGNK